MLNDQEAEFLIACDYLEETGFTRQANILRQTRRINDLKRVEPSRTELGEGIICKYPTNLGWNLHIEHTGNDLTLFESYDDGRRSAYRAIRYSQLENYTNNRWRGYWEHFDSYKETYYLVSGNRIPATVKHIYVNLVGLAPPYSINDAIMPNIGYTLHKNKFASAYDIFCSIRFIHPLTFVPMPRSVRSSIRSEKCKYTIGPHLGVFDLTKVNRTYLNSMVWSTLVQAHEAESLCHEDCLEMFTSNSTSLVD